MTLYTSGLCTIVDRHGLSLHFFADDTQVYAIFRVRDKVSAKSFSDNLEACITDIKA